MRQRQEQTGYVEVNTPDVMDRGLWETSGTGSTTAKTCSPRKPKDERVFALKPMNCPGAVSMYAHGLTATRPADAHGRSSAKVHRYEPSGALHGLLRECATFTQDDAHIFCTEAQMEQECRDVVALILDIYKDFGFDNVRIKLHPPGKTASVRTKSGISWKARCRRRWNR